MSDGYVPLADDELKVIHAALDFYLGNQSFRPNDPFIPIIQKLLAELRQVVTR